MVITTNEFRAKYIGLDSSPLIYFIEQNANFYSKLKPYFEANAQGDFIFVTSYLTLLEVLVYPFKQENTNIANKYHQILVNSNGLNIVPLDEKVALSAADLRARYTIRTPDSIQLATCITAGCSHFLTNDKALKKVEEIEVVVMDDLS